MSFTASQLPETKGPCASVSRMETDLLTAVCLNSLLKKVTVLLSSGICYVPNWMFKMLKFPEEGSPASVTLVPDLKK
jgi:hypothetical protein